MHIYAKDLPPIPPKRYFVIGEVAELCGVKPHVLRYWEQEFAQLKPLKRRGNRRYYQHHEVLMVRKIRELLYDQGFTIQGARNLLGNRMNAQNDIEANADAVLGLQSQIETGIEGGAETGLLNQGFEIFSESDPQWIRQELMAIQRILRA